MPAATGLGLITMFFQTNQISFLIKNKVFLKKLRILSNKKTKTDFYLQNAFCLNKNRRPRRTHWPQTKKHVKTQIVALQTRFVLKKNSACGVRSGTNKKGN